MQPFSCIVSCSTPTHNTLGVYYGDMNFIVRHGSCSVIAGPAPQRLLMTHRIRHYYLHNENYFDCNLFAQIIQVTRGSTNQNKPECEHITCSCAYKSMPLSNPDEFYLTGSASWSQISSPPPFQTPMYYICPLAHHGPKSRPPPPNFVDAKNDVHSRGSPFIRRGGIT